MFGFTRLSIVVLLIVRRYWQDYRKVHDTAYRKQRNATYNHPKLWTLLYSPRLSEVGVLIDNNIARGKETKYKVQ